MSGIFGLIDHGNNCNLEKARHEVDRWGRGRYRTDVTTADRCLRGRYHLGLFPQPGLDNSHGNHPVWITAGYILSGWSQPALNGISDALSSHRLSSLADLNGQFQICLHDSNRRSLCIVTDRFELMPLFYYHTPAVFAFAPDPSLLLRLLKSAGGIVSPEIDRESMAEWFEIGFVTGDRTLFRNIKIVPPASVLTWENGSCRTESYWKFDPVDSDRGFNSLEVGEALDLAIRSSLRDRVVDGTRVAVSLSGGLDSRLLAAAASREGLPVTSFTFGPAESDDHQIARSVADALAIPHVGYADTPAAAMAGFEAGIRRTGGMSNVFDLWGSQHGPAIAERADAVVNGIGGNEFFGFIAFDLLRFILPRSPDYLRSWLARKLNPGWASDRLASFRQRLAPGLDPFDKRLGARGFPSQGRSNVGTIYDFFLQEKSRRSNLLGLLVDDLHVEPLAPLFDNRVVGIARRIPPGAKRLAWFYRQFLARYFPEIARIPYSRTGLRADAPTPHLCLRKISNRLRGPGARSVNPWTQWLRNELREYAGDLIGTDSARIRELFGSDLVGTALADFKTGQNPNPMPIGQLMSCELFLRLFKPGM